MTAFSVGQGVAMAVGRGLTQAGAGGGALPIPSGFGWTPPVSVFRDSGTGVYSTDYDPASILIEGDPGVTTYYVDGQTGSEANPGTAALPKKSFRTITGGRVNKLLIKARGTFYFGITGPIFDAHDTLCVEAWGGADCILTNETDASLPFVWTDEGGGVWSAPAPSSTKDGIAVYSGSDVDSLTYYPFAASLAACQATAGTIFRTTGPIKHYVHTLTGASPATGHRIFGTNGGNTFYTDTKAYAQTAMFKGVTFLGGPASMDFAGNTTYAKRVDFVGCKFQLADNFSAFWARGKGTVILYQCEAGPSRYDGFAYTAFAGFVPDAMEIECIGRDNGYTSNANQGSTTHEGGKIVRVSCEYNGNANDQITDVNAGSRSWNLGVAIGPKGVASGFAGFACGNGGDPTMWLDGCTFTAVDFDVYASTAGGFIYYKNMPAPNINPATVGTVATY